MSIKKQFIVIKVSPGAVPKTQFITLPCSKLSDAGKAGSEAWIRSEILPGDAVLDEQDLLVSYSPDDDPDEELSGDVEGYYFAFTAGEDHYHVIVKDVLW